jgi:spermidine synthase
VLKSDHASFEGATTVYVNGLGQSWIPFGNVHSYLGLVPVLLHPDPRDVAVIGLGSGDTVFCAAGRAETRSIHCIEIIASQLDTLRRLQQRRPYAGLATLLDDARVRHVAGDGRRFLLQAGRRFDVIEADALRPTSSHAGNLYSEEYFELVRRSLKPGGFGVTWAPTARIHHTFVKVFPHVVAVEPMLIGSNEPIALDAAAVKARAESAHVRAHFEGSGVDLQQTVDGLLATFRVVERPAAPVPDAFLNTDLFPRDELRAR